MSPFYFIRLSTDASKFQNFLLMNLIPAIHKKSHYTNTIMYHYVLTELPFRHVLMQGSVHSPYRRAIVRLILCYVRAVYTYYMVYKYSVHT